MRIIFSFLIFMSTYSLYAQTNLKNYNIGLSFLKQNYQADEPVMVQLSIENIGNIGNTFILSDVLEQSIGFELKTSRNELLPLNSDTDIHLTGLFSNPALYRDISLMPSESFSRMFDLREFYDIKAYEIFYLKGIFYPDPDNNAVFVESEYTSFSHSPPSLVLQSILDRSIKRSEKIDLLSKLLPSEVVQNLFEAQFTKDWEKFLMLINAERLLNSFQNYAVQYNESTDGAFRLELVEKFKRFLTVHWNIPLVSYEILDTHIQGNTAYVTVDALESIRFTTRKIRYTFTLHRTISGSWLIVDYEVLSLN